MNEESLQHHACLLVAVSDQALRLQILEGMPNHGWRVLLAGSSAEIAALLLQHQPDILMLTPEMEVPEIILAAFQIPCVALQSRADDAEAIMLMRARGIAACFAPPLNLERLAASLVALRRLVQAPDLTPGQRLLHPRNDEVAESWVLHLSSWALLAPGGELIHLNQAETSFLASLAKVPGQAVSRKAMVTALGHDMDYFDLRRLDTLVSRLRLKVNKNSSVTLPVRSIHAVGYAFVAPIRCEA